MTTEAPATHRMSTARLEPTANEGGGALTNRERRASTGVDAALLVRRFYDEIWNSGDRSAVGRLLTLDVRFRGSLGTAMTGHDSFWTYVCEVRGALASYHCDIVELVSEGRSAAARLLFSGIHVSDLLGMPPSGAEVRWAGAAFFRTRGRRIRKVWVLGDIDGLRSQLARRLEQTAAIVPDRCEVNNA